MNTVPEYKITSKQESQACRKLRQRKQSARRLQKQLWHNRASTHKRHAEKSKWTQTRSGKQGNNSMCAVKRTNNSNENVDKRAGRMEPWLWHIVQTIRTAANTKQEHDQTNIKTQTTADAREKNVHVRTLEQTMLRSKVYARTHTIARIMAQTNTIKHRKHAHWIFARETFKRQTIRNKSMDSGIQITTKPQASNKSEKWNGGSEFRHNAESREENNNILLWKREC